MANISAIKLPNGTTYNLVDNTSGYIKSYTDEKLKTVALTSGTAYYPILAAEADSTAIRQVDSTLQGIKYTSTAGTTSVVGTAILQLGNTITSRTANNEQGVLRLYSNSTNYVDIKSLTNANNWQFFLPKGDGEAYNTNLNLVGASSVNTSIGSFTHPVFIEEGGLARAVQSIPYSLLTDTPSIPTKYSLGIYGTSGSTNSTQWMQAFSTKLFFKAGNNMGLEKDGDNIIFNAIIPASTQSATTGITATTTATKTTLGTASSVTGVSGSTTASKASGSNGSASNWVFEGVACDDITAWSAGSGSASLTFTMDTTDTKKLKISFSHSHTAPSLTYSAKTASHVKSGGNGTAPSWSFTDVTVPKAAASATSIPNVSVTSATVTITDNGHTHTI